MSSFEFNKIFAAVLCAGITAMLAGFVAGKLSHPEELDKDAVFVEGDAVAGGGPVSTGPEFAVPVLGLIASADTEKGAKIFKACAACHSVEKGGATKQGPNLWGVIGHPKGSVAGFDYSPAMKEKGGVWDMASLNQFLWKPKKFVDGTKMNFAGIAKEQDRADLIAWLRTQSDSPAAEPSQADIDAENALYAPKTEEAPAADDAAATDAPADAQAAPAAEEAEKSHH